MSIILGSVLAKLRPCPFCDDVNLLRKGGFSGSGGVWYVDCACCNARGPARYTLEAAIKAWNKQEEEYYE